MRDSFVFYKGWYEAIEEYPKEEFADAVHTLMRYALYDELPSEMSLLTKAIFKSAQGQIDANNKRYENSHKGGAPKGNQNARKFSKNNQKQPKVDLENNQSKTKKQPNVNDNDNENVNVNDNENVNVNDNENVNGAKALYFPQDEKLNTAFEEFIAFRKKIKASMTDRAIQLAINKVNELSGGDNDIAIKIINQSIMNGWKSLYPLKDNEVKRASGDYTWMLYE